MRFKTRQCAFTLVEVIAVIVVLAIVAAVALPRYLDFGSEARVSAAKGARAALAQAVVNWRLHDATISGGAGAWPPNLEDVLSSPESAGMLNPYRNPSQAIYDVDNGAVTKVYMRYKTIEEGVASGWGSIWYNPNNGRVCFRVPRQATQAATLALFNEVNQGTATSLSQITAN
ncbi:MAG: prepilin-type N-terminal cleavage/methylation domain-containing protein [Phycisphaerales bacterium JB039]